MFKWKVFFCFFFFEKDSFLIHYLNLTPTNPSIHTRPSRPHLLLLSLFFFLFTIYSEIYEYQNAMATESASYSLSLSLYIYIYFAVNNRQTNFVSWRHFSYPRCCCYSCSNRVCLQYDMTLVGVDSSLNICATIRLDPLTTISHFPKHPSIHP